MKDPEQKKRIKEIRNTSASQIEVMAPKIPAYLSGGGAIRTEKKN